MDSLLSYPVSGIGRHHQFRADEPLIPFRVDVLGHPVSQSEAPTMARAVPNDGERPSC
jgi:hypothetical protein